MRKIILSLLLVVSIAALSGAELLVTANPMGKGKLGALFSYYSNANYGNVAASAAAGPGGYIGYGLTENLDLIVTYAGMTVSNAPGITANGMGATLKYALFSENNGMPVSGAIGAGYKTLTLSVGGANSAGSQALLAAGFSKMMIPFIPYFGFAFRSSTASAAKAADQFDATLGTAFTLSSQLALFAEYTSQAIAPVGGNGYTSGQVAGAIAYMF